MSGLNPGSSVYLIVNEKSTLHYPFYCEIPTLLFAVELGLFDQYYKNPIVFPEISNSISHVISACHCIVICCHADRTVFPMAVQ